MKLEGRTNSPILLGAFALGLVWLYIILMRFRTQRIADGKDQPNDHEETHHGGRETRVHRTLPFKRRGDPCPKLGQSADTGSLEDETACRCERSVVRAHFLVKVVSMQGAEKLILRLVPGIVEIDRLACDGEALLAMQPDASFGTPCIERAGENIDVVGMD
jgi:hypothetical protein